MALLALMEFNASRMAARTDAAGEPILLMDQNRALWDRLQIRRGQLRAGAHPRARRRRRLLRAAGRDRGLPCRGRSARCNRLDAASPCSTATSPRWCNRR